MSHQKTLFEEPVTNLLEQWRQGDDSAMERLLPLIYEELHRRAVKYMRRERNGHTLGATELVHEAFLKMVDERDRVFKNRVHFCALAAKVMKDILTQYARARKTQKRGGDLVRITLNDEHLMNTSAYDSVLDLVRALDALAEKDARKAQIMEMFYFTDLKIGEIADVMGLSPATVNRELQFSRSWLKTYLEMNRDEDTG